MILNYFNILRDEKSEVFLQMKVYAKKTIVLMKSFVFEANIILP